MNRITAIVVDDEELARAAVKSCLAPHPEIEVAAECANGFEAVKAMAEMKPTLVFLDIQMPKLNGFEVLELAATDAAVIFVTAHDEYALRAFDVHAVDYLLKPFSQQRFDEALQRAKARIGRPSPPIRELAAAAMAPEQHIERIVVKDGARIHIIPTAKLDYAEAQDDYVALKSEGKSVLKQQTISSLEASLDPRQFVRIHRSYLVNLDRVAKIEPYAKDSRIAVLKDGTQLPISRTGYGRLRELLDARGR